MKRFEKYKIDEDYMILIDFIVLLSMIIIPIILGDIHYIAHHVPFRSFIFYMIVLDSILGILLVFLHSDIKEKKEKKEKKKWSIFTSYSKLQKENSTNSIIISNEKPFEKVTTIK